jgi:hypothetical protein
MHTLSFFSAKEYLEITGIILKVLASFCQSKVLNASNRPQSLNEIRLVEFAETSEAFAEVYKRAKAWQECKLVNGGLNKKYNCSMAKFVLVNHHAWKEKTEVSGDPINPIKFILNGIDGTSKDIVEKLFD